MLIASELICPALRQPPIPNEIPGRQLETCGRDPGYSADQEISERLLADRREFEKSLIEPALIDRQTVYDARRFTIATGPEFMNYGLIRIVTFLDRAANP